MSVNPLPPNEPNENNEHNENNEPNERNEANEERILEDGDAIIYEVPACPCEYDEILPRVSYRTPRPWVVYIQPVHASNYAEVADTTSQIISLTNAQARAEAAREALWHCETNSRAAARAASDAEVAAATGDRATALARARAAQVNELNSRTASAFAAQCAILPEGTIRDAYESFAVAAEYRGISMTAASAAHFSQITIEHATRARMAAESLPNVENIIEEAVRPEAAGSKPKDTEASCSRAEEPSCSYAEARVAVDEAATLGEAASKPESAEETAGQLVEGALLGKHEVSEE